MANPLYTSYETSLALRDAGAPQDGEDNWIEREGMNPYLNGGNPMLLRFETRGPRAFRADEIIEALGKEVCALHLLERDDGSMWWSVEMESLGSTGAISFIEALAAAWLAVLKEGK